MASENFLVIDLSRGDEECHETRFGSGKENLVHNNGILCIGNIFEISNNIDTLKKDRSASHLNEGIDFQSAPSQKELKSFTQNETNGCVQKLLGKRKLCAIQDEDDEDDEELVQHSKYQAFEDKRPSLIEKIIHPSSELVSFTSVAPSRVWRPIAKRIGDIQEEYAEMQSMKKWASQSLSPNSIHLTGDLTDFGETMLPIIPEGQTKNLQFQSIFDLAVMSRDIMKLQVQGTIN